MAADKTKHTNSNGHNNNNHISSKNKDVWDVKTSKQHRTCSRHVSQPRKTESVLSTDSDIRFTRRKLGDSQKCGCVVIAGFLVTLLFAGACVYIGYTYFRPDPLPQRAFRAKLLVKHGDQWSTELADQNSIRFQHKARDYRERINLVIRRSDLRDTYEGCEILALDGTDGEDDLFVHFILHFDPYRGIVSTADLLSIFLEEINAKPPRHFSELTIDPDALEIREVTDGMDDVTVTASFPLGNREEVSVEPSTTPIPPRYCQSIKLKYCKSVGYNMTTYPNFLGHTNVEEVYADVISFRELVDAECFHQAFDFVCRLLQPPCETKEPLEPQPGVICREYCQSFKKGCGDRLPERFKPFFDCERFPESTGAQSCYAQPGCALDMQTNALSSRICDGVADCPDLSDEASCSYCPKNYIYCGKGRACVSKTARCDGKFDCPDGADEKDCLTIAPMVADLTQPTPLTPHRPQFYSSGFAIFSEKGTTGKLCSEGLDTIPHSPFRRTVAESLCKALGYQKVLLAEVRNDTEPNTSYVRVLDPRAAEISFVRTACSKKQALFVSCDLLECGIQSALSPNNGNTLPKLSTFGDWPWHATLFRDDTHVCDATLVSPNWLLTTESCFQGQSRATWIAVFGGVRLNSNAPWVQRRRIIGMVKSPVEGSTAALVRLETSVVFSDFVRPVCLPDELETTTESHRGGLAPQRLTLSPNAQHKGPNDPLTKPQQKAFIQMKEVHEFFKSPTLESQELGGAFSKEFSAEFVDDSEISPRAEAQRMSYPLPPSSPQTLEYEQRINALQEVEPPRVDNEHIAKSPDHKWANCNTLGWSRTRDQLQRVQLKVGDMAACENISIASVNSICTEATFHKQDCNEEEFAGSPVLCMLPDNKRWALVGVSSWRIGCAPNGIERPRMYDKIVTNSNWIRDTINAA